MITAISLTCSESGKRLIFMWQWFIETIDWDYLKTQVNALLKSTDLNGITHPFMCPIFWRSIQSWHYALLLRETPHPHPPIGFVVLPRSLMWTKMVNVERSEWYPRLDATLKDRRQSGWRSTNLVILSIRSDLLFRDVKSVEYNIVVHLSGTCVE